ncbi:MAG TPA: hypothetical protein VFP27_12060 [Mycobacterium sp.]|nr:hypothetical protein [Mycobacterium sp.]
MLVGTLQAVTSITDTAGNTYTQSHGYGFGFSYNVEIWKSVNVAGNASNVVTVNLNTSGTLEGLTLQYSGIGSFVSGAGGSVFDSVRAYSLATTAEDQLALFISRTISTTATTTAVAPTEQLVLTNRHNANDWVIDDGSTSLSGITFSVRTVYGSANGHGSSVLLFSVSSSQDQPVRATQAVIEVLEGASEGDVCVTQEALEVVEGGSDGDIQVSQEVVELVWDPNALTVNVSDSVTVSESVTVATPARATIQVFQSRLDSALSSTNTIWNQAFGGSEGWSTTEASHQVRVLRACTVRNFAVELTTAPGGSVTRTFTIRKNGSNTALSFAITGSGTTGSDLANEVSFAAGDLIAVQIAQSGGTPAATGLIHYSLEVECSTAKTSIYGSARGGGGVVVGRQQGVFAGYEAFIDPSVEGSPISTSVAACAGSLTEYRIDLAGAPTAGKSWTFVIYKNGVKQDGAGGTTDTQLTIADAATTNTWTGTLTVAAGDLLRYQVESSSGSPASSAGSTACVFVSTTAGESHWCSYARGTSGTPYVSPLGMNTQSTTEASAQTKVLGPTAITLTQLWGYKHSIDATGITLRNNGSNTGLSLTLSTGVSVSDTTPSVTPAQNDLLSVSLTGLSGFFTSRVGISVCLYALSTAPPLEVSVSDSITVSESVTAVVTPLAVHASESVTVSESVTAASGSLQVHATRTQNNFSASATNYVSPINTQSWDATEHRGTVICAANGTFSNWKIVLPSAPGSGNSVTFTLRINQVDTAAVITISDTATSGQYTSPITLADGDELTIKSVPVSTPTVSNPSTSWDFLSATSGESIYGSANANGAVAISRTGRVLFHRDDSNWDNGGGRDVVSMAGTLNKLTIKLDADVGASGSFTFTINKNGVAQDGSGGTPDTRITFTTGTTKASSTFSLSISPGDTLSLSAVETGSAVTVRPITGVRATATTPGQSMVGAVAGNFVNGGTVYFYPTAGGAAGSDATEANREVTLGITGFRLKNLQVALNASPTNTYTFNTRKSGADGANSVAVTGGATTGSNSSFTQFDPGDRISMEVVPTPVTLTRAGGWSWIQDHLTAPVSVSVSDSLTVTESVSAQLVTARIVASVSDSLTVTESVTANLGVLPRQVLFGRNANPGAGGAKYTSITSALGTWDTEALRRSPCPVAGVVRNLVVELSAAPGGGRSRTFTLRKNGAATALTVTISSTATTARITGTDVAVAVGDLLALEATRSGSAAAASVRWSLEFEVAGSGYTSALGSTNSASGTRYAGVFAFTGTLATPVNDTRNVVAAAGALVRMVAAVNTAPGVSNGLTFYINKNGVRQDGSGGTVNTACALVGAITAVTATFSLSLAAGDVVYTECVPSGSFSSRNWSLGTAFSATTVGESQCCGATTNALSTSATQYAFVPAHASPGTTETAFAQRLIGGVTAIRLYDMQALLSVAPGIGKSRTLDLRKNATSPGPSVTISGASTTGSDTASGIVADTDQWDLRATPTSTPAAATAFWGLIQSSAEFETLSVDVHDSVSVTDAAVGQRGANKAASDSVSVSDSVTVQLNPLVARVSHTVTVSESVTVSGTLSRAVFDAITVTEPAVAVLLTPVLRVDVSDSITVTEAVTSSIPPSRFVFDTVSVSESVSVAFGTLSVDVHETIRVRETVIRNAAEPAEKTPVDFVRVVDVVLAQMYIDGGLAVRVSETITVAESPFNVGYDFAPGTTIPDTTALNIGPEPGVPEAGLGDDYWEDGY